MREANSKKNHPTCSTKKMFLTILKNSQENICARASFLIKKETLEQLFSCAFWESFKDTFLQNTSERLLVKILRLLIL